MSTPLQITLNVETSKGHKAVQTLVDSLTKAGATAAGVNIPTPNMAGLYDASGKIHTFSESAHDAGSAAADAGEQIEEAGRKTAGFGEKLMYLNQGLEVFNKVKDMIGGAITKAADMEQAIVQFGVLLGSEAEAKQRMVELTDFANNTPFELPDVVKASKLLQTFGGTALATGANLTMVGDMASAAGTGFNEIAMWVGRANTSIMSGREWGEAAMRLQELGLMSGTTRARLEALQASGAKNSEVWAAFTDSMKPYSGMMQKQAETLGGLQSTFADSVSSFQRDVAGAFVPALKDIVKFGTGAMNAFTTLPGAVKVLGAGLTMFIPIALLFQTSMGPWPYLILGATTAFLTLYTALKDGSGTAAAFVAVAAPIGLVLAGLSTGFITAAGGAVTFGLATTGTLIPALQKLAASFMEFLATPWGIAFVAAVAVTTLTMAVIAHYRGIDKAAQEHTAAVQRSTDDAAATMIANIGKLSRAKQVEAAKWEEAEATRARASLETAKAIKTAMGGTAEDLQRFEDQIAEQNARLWAAQKIIADGGIAQTKAQKEDVTKQLAELAKIRVDSMEDGYAKEKARTEQRHAEAVANIKKEITDEQIKNQALAAEATRHAREMLTLYENAVTPLSTLYTGNKGKGLGNFLPMPEIPADTMAARLARNSGNSPSADTVAGRRERMAQLTDQRDKATGDKDRVLIQKRINEEQGQIDIMDLTARMTASRDKAEQESLKRQIEATKARIGLIDAEKLAREEATAGIIAASMAEYAATKTIGENLRDVIVGRLKAYAADAVIGAVSKALSSVPFPFNIVLGAAAGVATMAAMNGIQSAMGFAYGGFVTGPGGAKDDKIPARLSNGEFVVNAAATAQARPLLEAINGGRDLASLIPISKMTRSTPAVDFGGTNRRLAAIERAINRPPAQQPVVINADHNWTTFEYAQNNFNRKQNRRKL